MPTSCLASLSESTAVESQLDHLWMNRCAFPAEAQCSGRILNAVGRLDVCCLCSGPEFMGVYPFSDMNALRSLCMSRLTPHKLELEGRNQQVLS